MIAKMSHKVLKTGSIHLGFWLLLMTTTLLCGTSAVFAGGTAGTIISPTNPSNGCLADAKNHPRDGVFSKSCGAGFTKHSVDNTSTYPWDTITSTEANECKTVGASEIYVLAAHRVKANANDTAPTYMGRFGLGLPVRQLKSIYTGGSGGVPYVAQYGALQFDEVYSAHQSALSYAQRHPEGFEKFLTTAWEDVTYFCWNPEWDNTTSSFNSWSYGSADGGNNFDTFGGGPDSSKEETIETENETVTVNFNHQLSYIAPTVDGTYGLAYTTWYTEVTEDDKKIGGENSQKYYTSPDGGPRADDVDNGFSNMLGASSNVITVEEGKSKKVCSTIYYQKKNIIWDENQSGAFIMNENESNGNASSTACVIIKRKVPVTSTGDYTSTTTVQVLANGSDITKTHELTSDEDGMDNSIVISTDQETTKVRFWHNIQWHGDKCPPSSHHDTVCKQTADTAYYVVNEAGARTGGTKDGDLTHTGNDASNHEDETIDVKLAKGETAKVCRKIHYKTKSITFTSGTETCPQSTPTNTITDTTWSLTGRSGDGESEACAVITRPADPDTPGPGKIQGPNSGSNDATPMYAGEDANISWETSTPTYDVRRLMQWQAISFQVPVYTGFNTNLSLGNIGKEERRTLTQDPCTWFNNNRRNNYRGCAVSVSSSDSGEQVGTGNEHKYAWSDGQFLNKTADASSNQTVLKEAFKAGPFSEKIVVPNLVGDKHCNSFGFQFQYYYAYIKNGAAEWHKDTTNAPYWTVYDAACRAIAKKPSVATWNGGLFSGGGSVNTSIARRYNGAALNVLARDSGNPIAFGSWSEYLATINGDVKGFTSGAVLASSGLNVPFDLLADSPLTIANTPSVGNSSIGANSVLFGRLQDYLFNQYDGIAPGGSIAKIKRDGDARSRSVGLGDNMQGTTIVSINGKLTIDQDIKLNTSRQNSIYTLPQVVIYAKDGIDITDNVTQIDAWLVTEGELDTCPGFVKSPNGDDTEADVDSYSSRNICSRSLQINGPVFAQNVILNRTYGADGFSNADRDLAGGNTRAATAEVFNLSADSYLWAWVQSGRYASSYSEAYSRELPPRY